MTQPQQKIRLIDRREKALFFGLSAFLFLFTFLISERISQAASEDRLTLPSAMGQATPEKGLSGSGVMSEEQWMMLVYEKGKDSYDRGNYEAAQAEWDKLNGVVERYPAFKMVIDYLRGREKTLSTDATDEVDRSLKERKKNISAIFEKGRELYNAGSMPEAFTQWDKLSSYLPEDAPQRKLIRDMKVYFERSKEAPPAQKPPAEVVSAEESARMTQFFNTAAENFKTQSERSRSAAAVPDDAQKIVDESFSKAKLLYYQGDYEKALKEIGILAPYLPEGSDARRSAEALSQAYKLSSGEKEAADKALSLKNVKVKLPDDFSGFAKEVSEKFAAEIKESEARRVAAEKSLQDKKTWVAADFKKGIDLYNEGKVDQAAEKWSQLIPIVDDGADLKQTIEALRSDYKASLKAAEEAKTAESKKSGKIPMSDEVSKSFLDMSRQIRSQIDGANARKRSAEQALIDKQAFVSEHYSRGKTLFSENDHAGALKEWADILPNLEDEAKLKTALEEVQKELRDLVSAQESASAAQKKKDQKVPTPQDLSKLLQEAKDKIRSQTVSAKDRKETAEKALADRERLIRNTYEAGKKSFDEGKYSEAVKQWATILDHLEDKEEIQGVMQEIEKSYEQSILSQKAAEEAEAKRDARLASPAGLSALLVEVKQKILGLSQAADAKKQAADKALAGRVASIDSRFEKGKLLFEEGKTEEALAEWSAILPELENGVALGAVLEELKAAEAARKSAESAAADSESRKGSKITAPDGLEKSLSDILAKLMGETQIAEGRKARADKELLDRKSLVLNTYDKGKALFDEGKYPEALREWTSVVSELEDETKFRELLLKADQDYKNLAVTEKAAAEAEARQAQKIRAPEGLAELIRQAGEKLRTHISDAQSQKMTAEQALAARETEAAQAVMRGNRWFEEGQWEEAKNEWLSILPVVEDPKAVEAAVEEFSKIREEELRVQKIKEEALALGSKKIKVPSDIAAELSDAAVKLKALTDEAAAAKRNAEQSLAARQAEIQSTFDSGKKSYWEGKLADAIQSWAKVAPYLEDSEIKKSIEALARSYEELLGLQKTAQEAELKKAGKLKTPEELPKLLQDMKQIVHSQTEYAETQKKIADQTFVDRQTLINSTFQKGKKLYEEDRIPEALEEWSTITPYLEKGSQLKEFIDGVAKSYENSLFVKRAADEAQLKKAVKFKAPEQMEGYLAQASDKLKAQVEDSRMQKEAADNLRRERQLFIDGKFQKGRLLYEQGKVEDAVVEWKAILPYIQDDSKMRQLILKAEESREKLQSEPPAAEPALIVPPDLEPVLLSANKKLEKKTEAKSREKLEQDVRDVIQNKKEKLRKSEPKKTAQPNPAVQLDEIEKMMLEYNIATPQELEKRHQELQAVK